MFDKELLQLPKIRSVLLALIAFSLLEAACILGQAFGLSHALVGLWQEGAPEAILANLSLFACSFVAVRIVLDLREAFIARYATRCVGGIRTELLESVFRTGAPAIQAFGTGTTAAMAIEGIDRVQEYLELVLPKFINMIVLPAVFALFITGADWVSGVVVIILLPSMVLLMTLVGKTTAENGRAQHASFKVMSNHFIDSVRGIRTLANFKISKDYADRVFDVSERFRAATMRTLRTATLSGALLDLFATLALAAVSIMLGLRLIDGSLTLLPALFVLILVPEYFRPIREFASNYHATLEGGNSLRTINRILAETAPQPRPVSLPSWTCDSVLRIENLTKDYGGLPALRDLSFEARGAECIGIVGASGSGKSTLLRILAGFDDPSSGSIEFEDDGQGARSVELATLRQFAWQDQIAYIPQDPYLFYGTLRDNLCFYDPEVSHEAIDHAVDVLGLRALVEELPLGLDTVIGEGGRGLSGGQAQRIALARVRLDAKRKVLLFDEPTAHLDIETEYELKAPMKAVMEGKLVFFATHRLHWADTFDRIFVLEDGRLAEQGSTDELRMAESRFSQLASHLRGRQSA